MCVLYQVDEVQVILWWDQVYIVQVVEVLVYWVLYVWIEVDWINDFQIWVMGQFGQCVVDVGKVVVEVFVVVFGDQQQFVIWGEEWECGIQICVQWCVVINVVYGLFQCVDYGVVGDGDVVFEIFLFQVIVGVGSRGEQMIGDYVDDVVVYFFGLGLIEVVGVQFGFDMFDWDVLMEGGQCSGYCGVGIVMYQNVVGLYLFVECIEFGE